MKHLLFSSSLPSPSSLPPISSVAPPTTADHHSGLHSCRLWLPGLLPGAHSRTGKLNPRLHACCPSTLPTEHILSLFHPIFPSSLEVLEASLIGLALSPRGTAGIADAVGVHLCAERPLGSACCAGCECGCVLCLLCLRGCTHP